MTLDSTADKSSSNSRARGRWKILRDALLAKSHELASASSRHSIHRFQGYNLLPAKTLSKEKSQDLDEKLSQVQVTADPDLGLEQQVERALLLRLALLHDGQARDGSDKTDGPSLCFDFTLHGSQQINWTDLDLFALTSRLQTHHSIELTCTWIGQDQQQSDSSSLHIQFQRSGLSNSSTQYSIMEYPLPITVNNNTSNKSLFIRQRLPSAKRSLAELASHQFHNGVDNTGNVCIWDAEQTLAWALLQSCQQGKMDETVKSITELGVGMAGLAALACAAVSDHLEVVTLTDGHMDCVRNNQLHARMLNLPMAGSEGSAARIDARQLLWTIDETDASETLPRPALADWTLVADCTHFQEYHAALFWTLIQCTHVGGTIWMCQPNRGQSWRRFCDLVECVNASISDHEPLVSPPNEQCFSELEVMHERFLRQPDSLYDPNIHQPRVFCLTKLRDATEQDRQRAIQHMDTRDK